MNTDLNKKIDEYLNGNLSGEELDAFQEALFEDSALADEVALFRLEKKGIERFKEQDLREKMKQWREQQAMPNVEKNDHNIDERHPDTFKTEGGKQSITWLWLFLPLLLAFGFYIWKNSGQNVDTPIINPSQMPQNTPIDKSQNLPQAQNTPSNDLQKPGIAKNMPTPNNQNQTSITLQAQNDKDEALALAFYQLPKNDDIILKSDKNTQNTDKTNPIDIQKPESIAGQIEKAKSGSVLAQYNVAHFYFVKKEYKLATDYFSQVSQKDKGELGDNAKWYLALSLVADGKREEAKQVLDKIIEENNHDKLEEAKDLRVKL